MNLADQKVCEYVEVEAVQVLYLYKRMRAAFESSTSKPRATNAGSKVQAAENAFTTGRYSHDVWLGPWGLLRGVRGLLRLCESLWRCSCDRNLPVLLVLSYRNVKT